jgi:hypothetical protein
VRRIYILQENEENGAVLDALEARGAALDESSLENPKCPACGSDTLLAYSSEDEFEVITWYTLDEEDVADADSWFLVCGNFDCTWEEQVERTTAPMGAELFDLDDAHHCFDEYCGLIWRPPNEMRELVEYLEQHQQRSPNRKLACFLDEARWRYKEDMNEVRKQLDQAPTGARITFDLDGRSVEARFWASTEDGVMVVTKAGSEMLVVNPEVVRSVSAWCDLDDDDEQPRLKKAMADASRWVICTGHYDMVVVRGFPLRLSWVDRIGQYWAGTDDPVAAAALGLRQEGVHWWKGEFRRSQIEARYEEFEMIKVRGLWMQVRGLRQSDHAPNVHTEDPELAAQLGLRPIHAYDERDKPEAERTIMYWAGGITEDLIEDRKMARTYHWPIPEHQPDEEP